MKRFSAIILAAGLLAWMPIQVRAEGEGASVQRADQATQEAASKAFEALVESANERFARSGPDKLPLLREFQQEFRDFAEKNPGTTDGVVALIYSAQMAEQVSDFEGADTALREAQKRTENPELLQQIQSGLARLSIRPGATPPAFTAHTVDGRTVTLADYAGKVLLLDFWATWCGPCVAELPNVKQVYATWHPKGLEILSISGDSERSEFDKFIKENGMVWSHVYNEDQPKNQDIFGIYQVTAIPRMILIGPDGKVLDVGLRGEALGAAVAKALGQSGT